VPPRVETLEAICQWILDLKQLLAPAVSFSV
jgi:hypothetical protein